MTTIATIATINHNNHNNPSSFQSLHISWGSRIKSNTAFEAWTVRTPDIGLDPVKQCLHAFAFVFNLIVARRCINNVKWVLPAVADEAENRNLSVSGYAVAPFLDGVLELFLQQFLIGGRNFKASRSPTTCTFERAMSNTKTP